MRRVLILAVLALFAIGPAIAQEEVQTPRLENLVPGNSFFLASLNDISSMRAECSRSAMGQLWKEPEVQQFMRPLMGMLGAQIKQAEAQLGHPILEIVDALKGQAAVAVMSYDPMYGGTIPDLAILVDLGEAREAIQKAHAKMVESAGERIGHARHEHNGATFESYVLPGGVEMAVAYFGDALVVTTMAERMRGMIDRHRGGPDGSLANNVTFRAVKKNTGPDACFTAFLNMEAVVAHFGDRIPPQASQIMDKLAVADVKGLGFGTTIAGEGLRETFYAHVPGEKRGLVKLLYTSLGDGTGLLKRVPKGAFWASAGRFDSASLFEQVLKIVGDVEPMALEQVMGQIYQAEEFMGFRIKEDLLMPLGDELAAYAAMPSGGGIIPDFVMMVKMKDPERFEKTLVKMVEKGQSLMAHEGRYSMSLRNLVHEGAKIHYIHVAQKWGDPVPVTPSYVRQGDLAYFSLYPQVLKDLAARKFTGSSILDRADFIRARRGLPEGMSSIEYIDFSAAIRIGYGTLVPILQAAAKDADMPIDMAHLPRTETVAKHFFGGAWGMKLKDDGVAIHAYTPCGVMPMVLVSLSPLMVMGMAVQRDMAFAAEAPARAIEVEPAPKRAPAPDRPVGAASDRLEDVYVALLWHYADKGAYPDHLAALVRTKALENPASLILPGEQAADDSGAQTSLDYVGPGVGDLTDGRGAAVWVYSREPVNGQRWVLFADGSRRHVKEASFQKMLEATKARLK